ncbi:MAG TPA: sulfur carrier protein ThiS [Solirubrobacteraceae bacterium]|jgi:sulfur carrier protein
MITVNGKETPFADATVADLLATLDVPDRGVAVAVDAEVVPKSEWGRFVVEDGAHVEVVTAVQGG